MVLHFQLRRSIWSLWLTLFIYKQLVEKYFNSGYERKNEDLNHITRSFISKKLKLCSMFLIFMLKNSIVWLFLQDMLRFI